MTYQTEVKLLVAWLVVAQVAAIVLAVVLLVRQPPEQNGYWRTVRRHLVLSTLLCCCIPALLLIVRSGMALLTVATPWVTGYGWIVPVFVAVAALGFAAWWLYSREQINGAPVQAEVLPTPQQPVQPPQMWSMPIEDQWDSTVR